MAQRHPDPGLAVNGEGPATPRGQAWQALLPPAAPPLGAPASHSELRLSQRQAHQSREITDLGGLQAAVRAWGCWGSHGGPGPAPAPPGLHQDLRATSRAGSEGRGGQRGKGPPEGTVGGRAGHRSRRLCSHSGCLRERNTFSVLKTPHPGASARERRAKGRQRGDTVGRRGRGRSPGGTCPPDRPRAPWGRAGTCGQRLVGQKRGDGRAPVDGAPGRGLPRASCSRVCPGLLGALGLGVFPVLGLDSPRREGSAGLSSGVAEGEGRRGRGP